METKKAIILYPFLWMGLVGLLTHSCDKENDRELPPVVTTKDVLSITPTTASCVGVITNDGGAAVTERGICWSTAQGPTIADGITRDGSGRGTFTGAITGLTATTTYYAKAYATNTAGTAYGNELVFRTFTDVLSDVDGNMYHTITIGTQTWMAENLRTTKFNDHTLIPMVADVPAWAAMSSPAFCLYSNDTALLRTTYGALYNWYAVSSSANGGKNVCPSGWHVPADDEWTTLTDFLGGENVAGGKMKESGTAHWQLPNTGATNESGFTALPGGGRYYHGTFASIDSIGGWWSATELLTTSARGRYLYHDRKMIYRGSGSKLDGFSVRCVKD